MKRTQITNYKGHDVFHMDFSNTMNEQEINPILVESKEYIHSKPYNSILAVTNMTNMFYNKNVASNFTKFVKGNKPYIIKSSVYGMSGLASIVFNSIMKLTGRDIRTFKTKDDALEYLMK